jgi:hypothetical protein
MRPRKPFIASMDQVKISRQGETANIEYADTSVGGVHLTIGAKISTMSDVDILDLHNSVLERQAELVRNYEHVAVEIPFGKPQLKYFKPGDQWTPRGDVLRCIISDGGEDGEATVYIDDKELSLQEFGKVLRTYAGWGMRVCFVPEEDIGNEPEIEIREPTDEQVVD